MKQKEWRKRDRIEVTLKVTASDFLGSLNFGRMLTNAFTSEIGLRLKFPIGRQMEDKYKCLHRERTVAQNCKRSQP